MAEKITYSQLFELVRNPETTDDELSKYFLLEKGVGGLDFDLAVNPDTVIMTETDQELESAMGLGNGVARMRRNMRYYNGVRHHPERPILLSEGDSWFQFPLLIKETIDHLSGSYNIWSLGAAGDTLSNMVEGDPRKKGFEFLMELRRLGPKVQAFLFSGAGNDILGEDPDTGRPMLEPLIAPFNGDAGDIMGHVDHAALDARLSQLEAGYLRMISLVRSEPGFEELPIVIHGYDYAYPHTDDTVDPRDPVYADKDQWLGRAFAAKGIQNGELAHGVVSHLVDRLYTMMQGLEDKSGFSGIWVVDCRGALPSISDWADEIHGTSAGFGVVAGRFKQVIEAALADAPAVG